MKYTMLILLYLFSSDAFSECKTLSYKETEFVSREETVLGGCRLFSPTIRAGYSNELEPFFSVGVLLPFDQTSDWEARFRDRGIVLVSSMYQDNKIIDMAYMDRTGFIILNFGWEAGMSYQHGQQDMRGIYGNASVLSGMLQLRYLQGGSSEKLVFEFGFKY